MWLSRLGLAGCAAVVLALSGATVAHASAADDVIKDCTLDEVLQGHYTQAELRHALAGLDADADEYTNCRAVIRQAQLQSASGVPPSSRVIDQAPSEDGVRRAASTPAPIAGPFGGFAAAPANPIASAGPAERQAIANVHVAAARLAAARADLPAPLIGVLAVGGLALLTGAGIALAARIGRGRRLGSGPP